MNDFEAMLICEKSAVERFVNFRIGVKADADDILQEVYIAAYQSFGVLKNKASFKPWLISIARNKCNDYFRSKAVQFEIPLDHINEKVLSVGRHGINEVNVVRDIVNLLGDKDKQILYLYFWKELSQAEIAKQLNIPLGTVKSRLHTAKRNFKNKYPYHYETPKGEFTMKKLPEYMPEYTIKANDKTPFSVKWEELMGWFLVPKLGEKLTWASYDMPSRRMGEMDEMDVVGKAEVHGIEGVEIKVRTSSPMACNSEGGQNKVERGFVAQLTDTHCRYLAESHLHDGVKKIYTFLDGESFLNNWGYGEDNSGNEINLTPKGDITRSGSLITSADKPFLIDIVGRYTVTIADISYDTVCVIDIETYNAGVVSEQFLDQNGRTVLWRRFNRNDWAIDRYQRPWTDLLPENERITVNGKTYVHWYDCISDYICE